MNPATNPMIAIPRSRFKQPFNHTTSFLHGDIFPIDCFEVLPGDDFSVHKAAAEIIMSTPIAPIMGNIKFKAVAMYVPTRLLWNHTEEFYGANKTSSGPQNIVYQIPHRSIFEDGISTYSVSHYLGKPFVSQDQTKSAAGFGFASVLKERGYWFIWSEWFRQQQLQDPFILDRGDNKYIGNLSGSGKLFNSLCAKCCKQWDMFTAATISPQYGAAVSLPLGTYAPVVGDSYTHSISNNGFLVGSSASSTVFDKVQIDSNGSLIVSNDSTAGSAVGAINLVADLSAATAAKINDIRYAFQLQKYLERANFGTRFFEVLAVHYGVTSPDSRLQRPEYLGGKTAPIIVRTVLSQAGYDAGTGQKVGQPGASSITMIDLSGLFSKGFVEPGYVYILGLTNHERLYSQGLLREDTKFDRFEFYSPEFANLGDQAILNKEIMVTGDASDDQVFGYQGHWDEYRYRKNRVSGILDPVVSGSLDYWTLSEKFSSRPSLSPSFIVENRDALSRCLVTGANGPDYIGDFYIEYAATRELPLYNIPGLIDHFGAL